MSVVDTPSRSPANAWNTVLNSAGVELQNSPGRHPSNTPAVPASRSAASRNSVTALKDLAQQHPQDRRRLDEPDFHYGGRDPVARRILVGAMPEQGRHRGKLEIARRRPLDQGEERPEFRFGGDQGFEGWTQHDGFAVHDKRSFAARRVRAHNEATGPELSRLKA